MIKILIVDDSLTETALLKKIFESEPDLHVVGCAKNGKEAVKLTATLKPDLITMDLDMPVMDGFEATRLIMSSHPVPIVVISSRINDELLNATFKSLEAGALSVIEKPVNITHSSFIEKRKRMIDTLRSMAEIKVIKRRFHVPHTPKKIIKSADEFKSDNYELIAIGASVGGPQALKEILEQLPADFPLPIAVVQHMTQGFIAGYTAWLNEHVKLKVKYVEHNEVLQKGTVYFAPDSCHFEVAHSEKKLIAKLVRGPRVSGFCPSVTMLFHSVAKTCGKNAVGIILTGMGNDGAQGLLDMKHHHAHTIIQDPESAVVFGMAGVAQSIGAVDKVVELDQMANYLLKITARSSHRKNPAF